ncbi:hypothetical protein R3P38DRAFT_2636232 [Favolaschia claudopus]|uniref:Uncharacterized protein n=1 Tax=Favolaschia claudopus TaxID=2862362 RepID=A0AAW0ATK6_9AGAR
MSQALTARDHFHPRWYIRCVMYLVAFLHTKHRVTFRAAALILVCAAFLFTCFVGNMVDPIKVPETLKTVFSRFEIKDNFVVNPTCFRCHYVLEPDVASDTFCPECNAEVFGAAWQTADNPARVQKRKPQLVSPVQLLSEGLKDFFRRPGMVAAVNSWKHRTVVEGELKCMQDAAVWKTIKDANGHSFFFGPGVDKEIRLGVSFSLDWYAVQQILLTIAECSLGSSEARVALPLVDPPARCRSVLKTWRPV